MVWMIWPLGAAVTALSIVFDMRRLMINRVGLSSMGWVVACVCAGPLAGGAYLILRRGARRQLVEAVWRIAGDQFQPVDLRRARLIALLRSGLVGAPVFHACMKQLDAERPATGT
ncbi:hypothetical protein [Paraburkholderia sp. ZP32-5]|uniref:hypothetical protein n=1 Tax=Paraburkholderia sp. ZP32-5 TaxID=2883245 RepID=UPI001F2F2FC1|nr:hypothetical protein [Paraburkholderia sp. ZP32-5]